MSIEGCSDSIENPIIDSDAITQWLNREAAWPHGARVTDVSVHRIWQSAGGCSTFELQLSLQDREKELKPLLQGGFGAPQYQPRPKARCGQRWITHLRLVNKPLGVWVCSPDRDPALRLRAHMDAKRHGDAIIAYRVGKRCVLYRPSAAGNACGWYMKFSARRINPDRLRELNRVGEALRIQSKGFVRIAPVVAVDREARMIATQEVRCETPAESGEAAAALAARAACELHDVACESGREHTPTDEVETVRRWDSAVARHQPYVHSTLGSILVDLARFAEALPKTARSTIHRDFYAGQVLLGKNGAWLLDIDTLCRGHREQDIATYCAHLLHEYRDSPHQGLACVRAFLDGYEKGCSSISRPHLRFYLCAATARVTLIHVLRGLQWNSMWRLWATARTTLYAGVEAGFDRYVAGATAVQ